MKKQRRFNIADDMQLDYVICALDDIDYELSLYQYRVANAFEHSEEAYDALGRARTLLHEFQRDSLGIVDGSEGESIDESCK